MLADNEAVTIAVNIAMMIIPTRIHTMQNIRAKNDLGARSPYLTRRRITDVNHHGLNHELSSLTQCLGNCSYYLSSITLPSRSERGMF